MADTSESDVDSQCPGHGQDPTDGGVVRRVLAGDRDAYRLLVRRYELNIRGYLGSQLYRLDDVDDLAQEAFVAAFKGLTSYDPAIPFGSWLRGIARHLLHTHFRVSRRRSELMNRFRLEATELIAGGLDELFQHESSDRIEALLRCIDKLPDRMLHVVRAGLQGVCSSRIAAELATSVAAIYNLQYRANQLLRRCVTEQTSHE